jgi:hypothetical protein
VLLPALSVDPLFQLRGIEVAITDVAPVLGS